MKNNEFSILHSTMALISNQLAQINILLLRDLELKGGVDFKVKNAIDDLHDKQLELIGLIAKLSHYKPEESSL